MDKNIIRTVLNMSSIQFEDNKSFVEQVIEIPPMCEYDHNGDSIMIYYEIDFSKETCKQLKKKDEKYLRNISKNSDDKYLKLFIWKILSSLGCVKHRS